MKPTEILSAEHRIIEGILDCLLVMSDEATAGARLDVDSAGQAIQFLRTFADGCHHGKEEHHLFALMCEKGLPLEGGPVGVMLHEHDLGRDLIRRMDEARLGAERNAPGSGEAFAEAARGYVELLRAHIQKEDGILYPMANRLFSASDQEALLGAFERTESVDMGAGTHERMLAIAAALHERFGVPQPKAPAPHCCGHAH